MEPRSNSIEPTLDIKKCIISDNPSGLLVSFDFSQLEIAALAEITLDPVLIQEVNARVDLHRENAAMWLKKDPSLVTDKERKHAKIMTFQLQYGAGYKKMSDTLGITPKEAKDFIKAFYDKYEQVAIWHEQLKMRQKFLTENNAHLEGTHMYHGHEHTSPVDRNYFVNCSKDSSSGEPYLPLTAMKNYPVQGFATGDLVPIVVNRVQNIIKHQNLQNTIVLVNTVHDDFTYDLTSAEHLYILLQIVEYSFATLREYFTKYFHYTLQVDYTYEAKVGENLSEVAKLTRKDIIELLQENCEETNGE